MSGGPLEKVGGHTGIQGIPQKVRLFPAGLLEKAQLFVRHSIFSCKIEKKLCLLLSLSLFFLRHPRDTFSSLLAEIALKHHFWAI